MSGEKMSPSYETNATAVITAGSCIRMSTVLILTCFMNNLLKFESSAVHYSVIFARLSFVL